MSHPDLPRSPVDPDPRMEVCIYCGGRGLIRRQYWATPEDRWKHYVEVTDFPCQDCDGSGYRCSECLEPWKDCQC